MRSWEVAFALGTALLGGCNDMLQIEKPEACVRALLSFLDECGIAT